MNSSNVQGTDNTLGAEVAIASSIPTVRPSSGVFGSPDRRRDGDERMLVPGVPVFLTPHRSTIVCLSLDLSVPGNAR